MTRPRQSTRTAPRRRLSASAPVAPPREHGDWRVPVANAAETENMRPQPLRKRVRYKVQALTQGDYIRPGIDTFQDWSPASGWKCFIRRSIGLLLLLPLSIVMTFALLVQLYHAAPMVSSTSFLLSEPVWYSLMGVGLFLSLRIISQLEPITVYIYVLGHELTHAIAAWLSFSKVQTIHFDMEGGYVETEADNLFVALSPYFVPLWMLCWLSILFVVNFFFPFAEYNAWFYAGLGFWWTFHLHWTAWIIPREQPDLLENELVFSTLLIMLINVGILIGLLICFGVVSPSGYYTDFLNCARSIWAMLSDVSLWFWETFRIGMSSLG